MRKLLKWMVRYSTNKLYLILNILLSPQIAARAYFILLRQKDIERILPLAALQVGNRRRMHRARWCCASRLCIPRAFIVFPSAYLRACRPVPRGFGRPASRVPSNAYHRECIARMGRCCLTRNHRVFSSQPPHTETVTVSPSSPSTIQSPFFSIFLPQSRSVGQF